MSIEQQNTDYINDHISNVKKGYEFIKENVPEMLEGCDIKKLDQIIENHDKSKWSKEEFMPYAEHFFGKYKGLDTDEDPEFKKAWRHHFTTNKHHAEYWHGMKIPSEYIIEMICDWWSFSWKKNNLNEIFEYSHSNKIDSLYPETKKELETKLGMLKKKLKSMDLI